MDSVLCRFYDKNDWPQLRYVRGQSWNANGTPNHRGDDVRAYNVPSSSTPVLLRIPYRSTIEVAGTMSGNSATWGKLVKGKMLEGPFSGLSFLVAHQNVLYVESGRTYDAGVAMGNEGWTGHTMPAGAGGRHAHIELLNGWTVQRNVADLTGFVGKAINAQYLNTYSVNGGIDTTWKGIDVSKYQGVIDWAKVKADGVKFAFIRIAWAGFDGTLYTKNGQPGLDEYFERNMQNAIAAGIPVGIYVYSYCKDEAAAKRAAQLVLQQAAKYKVQMPIAFDFEDSAQYASYGKVKNTSICAAFLQEIERARYYAMMYTYTNFANNYLDMSALSGYDFWVADYRGYVGYQGPYGIWQHRSDGSVSGISGNVDINIAYKDYPTVIYNAGLNNLTEEPTPPEPGPIPEGDDTVTRVDVLQGDTLEVFTEADVNKTMEGIEGRSRRIDAGHYLGLELVSLKHMPTGYSSAGFKIQVGDERLYIATGIGNVNLTLRTMEQIVDEFGIGGCDCTEEVQRLQDVITRAKNASAVSVQEAMHTDNILNEG